MNNTKQNAGCADIVCSRAWYDNDIDSWHIEHLWCDTKERPMYTVCDCDGNHETIDGRSVQKYMAEASKSWDDYAAWAVKTGRDPLHNFMVEYHAVTREEWLVAIRNWNGNAKYGLAIGSAKRGGPGRAWIWPRQFPKHLRQFLNMRRTGKVFYIDGMHSIKEISSDYPVSIHGSQMLLRIPEIENKQPRPAAEIAADVRRFARNSVQ